jgi:hypothetical protein
MPGLWLGHLRYSSEETPCNLHLVKERKCEENTRSSGYKSAGHRLDIILGVMVTNRLKNTRVCERNN